MGVRQLYEQTLAERAQQRAIDALERCEEEWADYKARRANAIAKLLARPPIPRGVYLWGGVGRGKSFLMDCFFTALPLTRKTRLHFHEFMREVHRELAEMSGTSDPLQHLGRDRTIGDNVVLADLAIAKDNASLGKLRNVVLVRDQNNGQAFLVQLLENLHDLD